MANVRSFESKMTPNETRFRTEHGVCLCELGLEVADLGVCILQRVDVAPTCSPRTPRHATPCVMPMSSIPWYDTAWFHRIDDVSAIVDAMKRVCKRYAMRDVYPQHLLAVSACRICLPACLPLIWKGT
jgi:hypothetical protein